MFCSQRNCLVVAFAAVCATVGAAQPASGADLGSAPSAPPLASPSPWTISVTPYGWLPFLKGDATIRGRTAEVDVNPWEVLEHLDAVPWMSYIEARRGPLSFYNDIFLAKLGIDVGGARTFGGATLDATLGLDFTQTIIEVGGTYEIAKWSSGGGSHATAIDLLAGARYWHQDLSLRLALTGTLDTTGLFLTGTRAIARSGSVDWVDPLVGARVRHQLAPGKELVLRGDIGGFDVGSRFSWNLLGAYSWTIGARQGVSYEGILGYRLLSVDYERGSGFTTYEYDVLQHGPIMGLTVKF
jgi:hypothetical protein